MKRLPFFLFVLAMLFLFGSLSPEGTGFETICADDVCRSAAKGSLRGIFAGLAIGVSVWLLPYKGVEPAGTDPVGVFRRLGALYVNMFVVIFTFTPIAILPILFLEAEHVGDFQWSFERDFSRDTDFLVGGVSVFFLFALLFYNYYRSLMRGRPTVGQYLMGYQVVSTSEPWTRGKAMKRMGLTLLELCAWPVTAFLAVGRDKKAFWWDLKTDSIAERFAYADEEEAG